MSEVLRKQYELIQATRESLLTFMENIAPEHLHERIEGFGSGSILETHLHVADCYQAWLGRFALNRTDLVFSEPEDVEHADVVKVREKFRTVNALVQEFFDDFDARWFDPVENYVEFLGKSWTTTPLWLLTHTETHEFHHKGQIVAMARHLGYIPPDTDLTIQENLSEA